MPVPSLVILFTDNGNKTDSDPEKNNHNQLTQRFRLKPVAQRHWLAVIVKVSEQFNGDFNLHFWKSSFNLYSENPQVLQVL